MNNKSFDYKRIVNGYAKDRPWLHKQVIERIIPDCEIILSNETAFSKTFHNGLDVGCGAGLSTKALKLICDKVTGTDISNEMIRMCKNLYSTPDFAFFTAPAEETPLPQTPYDIVTAAGVINWVDKDKFLENMKLVMAKGALLVIYDFSISDKMVENTDYTNWYQSQYLNDFPKPPRNEEAWHQEELPEGFAIKKQIKYQLQHKFNMDSFIRFMMIQSNVNVRIENGSGTEEEIQKWMCETLKPIFKGKNQTLIFNGYSWYIQYGI